MERISEAIARTGVMSKPTKEFSGISTTKPLPEAEFEAQVGAVSAAHLADIARRRRDVKRVAVEAILDRAEVPLRFKSRSLDNFEAVTEDQKRALATCRRYVSRFEDMASLGVCLVLAGRPGTGKTHLAVGILGEVCREGRTGLFVTVSEMLRAIRATYSSSSQKTESEVFKAFINAELLVLDEVGVAIGDEHKRKALIFDVINGRYNALRPTIVIGNLKPDEMSRYLGERVWDRLLDNHAPVIAFDWESWRQRKIAQQGVGQQ